MIRRAAGNENVAILFLTGQELNELYRLLVSDYPATRRVERQSLVDLVHAQGLFGVGG